MTNIEDKIKILSKTIEFYRNPKLERLIAQYPDNSSINLSYQQLTDQDLKIVIKQAIGYKKCTELSLYSNEITAEGASMLAAAIKDNIILWKLCIWDNPLNDLGIRSLTEALSTGNSVLRDLRIGWTGVTDQGAFYLAELLKVNNLLTDLWMRENKIGDRGVEHLTNALAYHNKSLKILWLRGNTLITDGSIDYIINMLRHNQTLEQFSIELCDLSQSGKDRLREEAATKTNFSLWL